MIICFDQLLGKTCPRGLASSTRDALLSLQSADSGGFSTATGLPSGLCLLIISSFAYLVYIDWRQLSLCVGVLIQTCAVYITHCCICN